MTVSRKAATKVSKSSPTSKKKAPAKKAAAPKAAAPKAPAPKAAATKAAAPKPAAAKTPAPATKAAVSKTTSARKVVAAAGGNGRSAAGFVDGLARRLDEHRREILHLYRHDL